MNDMIVAFLKDALDEAKHINKFAIYQLLDRRKQQMSFEYPNDIDITDDTKQEQKEEAIESLTPTDDKEITDN